MKLQHQRKKSGALLLLVLLLLLLLRISENSHHTGLSSGCSISSYLSHLGGAVVGGRAGAGGRGAGGVCVRVPRHVCVPSCVVLTSKSSSKRMLQQKARHTSPFLAQHETQDKARATAA